MQEKSFESALLKLDRAKKHLADFISSAQKHYDLPTERFILDHNPRTRRRTLSLNMALEVPKQFSVMIGDVIHNLRAALDYVTWEIVSPFAPPRPSEVQFPFCSKEELFETALKKRQIDLAGTAVLGKFRELKPYPNGNELLYGLHQLDIVDKHRLIVPVFSIIGFDVLDLRDFDLDAPPGVIRKTAFNLSKDNRLAIWDYDPSKPWRRPERETHFDVAIQIMFEKDQPLGGRNVPATLEGIAVMVGAAIDSLTP